MATLEGIKAGTEEPNDESARFRALAKLLGLRENFLLDLLGDSDDWSFLVKAHALLESVICALLAMHLRKLELEGVPAEEVEMKARIEMTKALAITTSEDRKMMYALGKLRNRLVHTLNGQRAVIMSDRNIRLATHPQSRRCSSARCRPIRLSEPGRQGVSSRRSSL
jgi:hypothetical protein